MWCQRKSAQRVKGDLAVLNLLPCKCRPQPALIGLMFSPPVQQARGILGQVSNLLFGSGYLIVVSLIDVVELSGSLNRMIAGGRG